jgi:hypothetical protein
MSGARSEGIGLRFASPTDCIIERGDIYVADVVVGDPALPLTRCFTLEQLELVNVFCRAVDEGAASEAAGGMIS